MSNYAPIVGTTAASKRGKCVAVYASKPTAEGAETRVFVNETANGLEATIRHTSARDAKPVFFNHLFDRRTKKDGTRAKPVSDKAGNQLCFGTQRIEAGDRAESEDAYASRKALMFVYDGSAGSRGYITLPGSIVNVEFVEATERAPAAIVEASAPTVQSL
jgi:hypothetical protein